MGWGEGSLIKFCPASPDCTCSFKDRCKLREHLRSHTQEKVVACPTCGGMFANNTKFLDHIRRQTALDRMLLGVLEGMGCSHPTGISVGTCSQGRGGANLPGWLSRPSPCLYCLPLL